jgi:hypothetical protein
MMLDNWKIRLLRSACSQNSIRNFKEEEMKRALGILLIIGLVTLLAGCGLFDKHYYFAYGDSTSGYCYQVDTSDSNLESYLAASIYTEGTCADHGFGTSHSCSISASYNGMSYDETVYYGSTWITSASQTACTSAGGTYK